MRLFRLRLAAPVMRLARMFADLSVWISGTRVKAASPDEYRRFHAWSQSHGQPTELGRRP